MYAILLNVHSYLRWLVLILGILAIYRGFKGAQSGAPFTESDRKSGLFFLISVHTQLLIGLLLYFVFSPITQAAFADFGAAMKDPAVRLIAVEHITVNILAAILVTVAYSKNKKAIADAQKHKNAWLLFGIALLLILSRIPWSRLA
ncbi:hypothetical protein G9H64_00900 [Aquirufa nivalisilvae]|uniref:Uncharacterized protein n=1 Tax=Aquirufa nivalisilvae TaxID=2516557 RepID=A0A2S2DSH6_9BACT|nr:hypothetical protein [Aquirufa nivalisilvae]AWL08000.1 hypothetical protein HME7025_00117 [Aquirufa nivalisilvae]MCZ2479509.1 hypothetical protein [Aquirufa nivalisilvae]MCZ2481499.1 hypothetical protein [Aquirufa nivalisilvae]TBH76397.1 hypothetical protein EWU22_02330 [Aquirufa nivalisilvae]